MTIPYKHTERERWRVAMLDKGHKPKLTDNGNLEMFVLDDENHNGPSCVACGWSICWHCYDVDVITPCGANADT